MRHTSKTFFNVFCQKMKILFLIFALSSIVSCDYRNKKGAANSDSNEHSLYTDSNSINSNLVWLISNPYNNIDLYNFDMLFYRDSVFHKHNDKLLSEIENICDSSTKCIIRFVWDQRIILNYPHNCNCFPSSHSAHAGNVFLSYIIVNTDHNVVVSSGNNSFGMLIDSTEISYSELASFFYYGSLTEECFDDEYMSITLFHKDTVLHNAYCNNNYDVIFFDCIIDSNSSFEKLFCLATKCLDFDEISKCRKSIFERYFDSLFLDDTLIFDESDTVIHPVNLP